MQISPESSSELVPDDRRGFGAVSGGFGFAGGGGLGFGTGVSPCFNEEKTQKTLMKQISGCGGLF